MLWERENTFANKTCTRMCICSICAHKPPSILEPKSVLALSHAESLELRCSTSGSSAGCTSSLSASKWGLNPGTPCRSDLELIAGVGSGLFRKNSDFLAKMMWSCWFRAYAPIINEQPNLGPHACGWTFG